MKIHSLLLIPSILLVTAASLPAQIVWSTPQAMSDASDISQAGTYVDAISTHSINGLDTTIGDTTFRDINSQFSGPSNNPSSPPLYFGTDGTISLTADAQANAFNPFITPDAAYQNAVSYAVYLNQGEIGSIAFGSLLSGHTYQIQVWSYYPTNFPTTLDGATPVSLDTDPGAFVLGTFTASSASFSFDYTRSNPSSVGLVNAIALRDLGVVEAPEPSTWALLLGGSCFLAVIQRFRKTLS